MADGAPLIEVDGGPLDRALWAVLYPAPNDDLAHAEDCRAAAVLLRERAAAITAQQCRGRHAPVQHRDARPPWCDLCGRGREGQLIRPDRAPGAGG